MNPVLLRSQPTPSPPPTFAVGPLLVKRTTRKKKLNLLTPTKTIALASCSQLPAPSPRTRPPRSALPVVVTLPAGTPVPTPQPHAPNVTGEPR